MIITYKYYSHCNYFNKLLCNISENLRSVRCSCELGCSNTVYEVEKLAGNENQDM